jgi:hypothetical protein
MAHHVNRATSLACLPALNVHGRHTSFGKTGIAADLLCGGKVPWLIA